jgi:hypothetical protein
MNLCLYYNYNATPWIVHCEHPLNTDKEIVHEFCGTDECPLYTKLEWEKMNVL